MDINDLTPAGAGSLRAPVTGPGGQTVASFTVPAPHRLDEIWHGQPDTRLTDATRDGSQGDAFGGYRPGRSIEHEPVDKAERDAQHTAQNAGDFEAALNHVREGLRPGVA